MADRGDVTRARIVAAAEALILRQGYAGTSLDDVLKATDLTKGAFFHHFRSKADLAQAVLESYAQADLALFEGWSREADEGSQDPLDRVLRFLTAFERYLDGLGRPFAGCIFASYTYESRQFGAEVHAYIRDRLEAWLAIYEAKLGALIETRPPREAVTARQLAEMATSLIEGGFVMANAYEDKAWVQRQSEQYRRYLRLLFAP